MRQHFIAIFAAALLLAGMLLPAPLGAQTNPPKPAAPLAPGPAQAAPAPAKPYKPVAITLPQPMKDASLDAFRKQLGDVAQKKDRAALSKLVVGQGFFWERENGGDATDKKKSGMDNFANTLGLNSKDGAGWEVLAGYAAEKTASNSPDHKGAICAPADPAFNDKEFDELLKATQTDPSEWGYTLANGVEVHAAPQAGAPVVEKLGLQFVRVLPDSSPAVAVAAYLRVVMPSGKTGFATADAIAPLGNDQICYVNEAGAWKVGGFIGVGEAQ